MAQTVILEKRVLSFVFFDSLGAWSSNSNPALFVPEVGAEYSIYWDGNSYSCIGFTSAAIPDNYLLGNPLPAGGADNGIPFLMSAISDGSGMSIMTFDQGDTHEVGIYKVEEDAEPPSADVKIKGYSGSYLNYEKVPKVWLASPESTGDNPVLVPFTYGEALDNVEITPDFSAGNQKITLPEGYMARSIVVKKPENVITEPDSWIEFTLDENNEIISAAPHNFEDIPDGCFAYMTSLHSVDLTNSPAINSIGENAFRNCILLSGIQIPLDVTDIGPYAFSFCESLVDISIPDSVTSIGTNAFRACTGLTSIVIPDSVTSIGTNAFYGCTGLTSIVIPDSVTSIGTNTFFGCTGLTSIVIPDSVTSIESSAFYGCTGLTSIVIPDSVTSIESSAFQGCTGLTDIVISDGVTKIGKSAFQNCTGLESIIIPSSVQKIEFQAFYKCDNLTTAIFRDTSGWFVSTKDNATSGTSIAVSDPTKAATDLTTTYKSYYWYDNT